MAKSSTKFENIIENVTFVQLCITNSNNVSFELDALDGA